MILEPPPQYDMPYNGPLLVWEMTAPQVDNTCRAVGGKSFGYVGCQYKIGDTCYIVMVKEHPQKDTIKRHERAHCNGWRHD